MKRTYFIFEGKKRYVKGVKDKSIADFAILKKQFNQKKNNIDPKLVPFRSQINFYWKCEKKHEWQISPGNRFTYMAPSSKLKNKKISGCPYCLNLKVSNDNNLKFLHPKIAKMWDYEKNKLKPEEYTARSHKKVWWKCKNNHKFKKLIYLHVDQKGFCGGCGKEDGSYKTFVTDENCLENKYPNLAKEWHPTKNKLKPKEVYKSTVMYWWLCPKQKDHEYKQTIWERAKKNVGCPFCAFKKLTKSNSLKFMYPTVASQWHPTKNGKLKPDKVLAHSHKKAWWICKKKHVWKAQVVSRAKYGHGCRKCTGVGISYMEIRIYSELINIFKDIKWSYKIKGYQCDIFIPQLKLGIEVDGKYWHNVKRRIDFDYKKNEFFKKNGLKLIRLREIGLPLIDTNTDINAYFVNPKKEDLNNLLSKIQEIKNNRKIQKYVNKYKKEKKFVNEKLYREICANLPSPVFENSLEYKRKDLVKEWDFKKNFPLVPSMFKTGSQLSVWWICPKKHNYEARIGNRCILKRNCPYCAGRYALENFNLKIKFPKIAKEWHPSLNGKLKPENFTPTSGQYVWWKCKNKHSFRKTIARRIKQKANCPCFLKNDKSTNFKASIFPLLRKEFLENKNNIKLNEIEIDDKNFYWWKCKNNHIYKNSIYNRTFYMERCPKKECKDIAMEFHKDLHQKTNL